MNDLQQLFRECLGKPELWEVSGEGSVLTYKLDTRIVIEPHTRSGYYSVTGEFSGRLMVNAPEITLIRKVVSKLYTDPKDAELEKALLQGVGKVRPKPASKPPTKVKCRTAEEIDTLCREALAEWDFVKMPPPPPAPPEEPKSRILDDRYIDYTCRCSWEESGPEDRGIGVHDSHTSWTPSLGDLLLYDDINPAPPPRRVKGGKPSMPKPPKPIERKPEGPRVVVKPLGVDRYNTLWQSFKDFLFYKGD